MGIPRPRFGSLGPMDSHEAGQMSGDGARPELAGWPAPILAEASVVHGGVEPSVEPDAEPDAEPDLQRAAESRTEPLAEPAAGPATEPQGARASLLLVDNDARIVELLTWFLSQRGFQVRTAGSFVEARERLAEGAPDLLVSDVDLGAESAVQELPRLRADGILPRTLVVSGYLDAAIKTALTALPEVVGTLAKPFEFTDLEAAIESALSGAKDKADAVPGVGAFEVPRPERAPVPAPEVVESGGGASLDEDDDDDGWIEITPGS